MNSKNNFSINLFNTKIKNLCINGVLLNNGFPRDAAFKLSFVLEEILANIIKYSGYSGKIKIEFSKYSEKIRIRLSDDGKKFNPLTVPEPDLNENLKERKEGGLGLFLVKNYADNISYKRIGKYNVTELTMHIGRQISDFQKLKEDIKLKLS